MPIIFLFFLIPVLFSWQIWLNVVISCKMDFDGKIPIFSSPIISIDSPTYFVSFSPPIKGIEKSLIIYQIHIFQLKISMSLLVVSFSSAVISFAMNLVIISVMLYRRCVQVDGAQATNTANTELKLFFLSMLMFFNECVLGGIQVRYKREKSK